MNAVVTFLTFESEFRYFAFIETSCTVSCRVDIRIPLARLDTRPAVSKTRYAVERMSCSVRFICFAILAVENVIVPA